MIQIRISEDAFDDLNQGFLFYETRDPHRITDRLGE